jgi:hypothetical protein
VNEAVQNAYLQWLTGSTPDHPLNSDSFLELSVRTRKALVRWAAQNNWHFTPDLLARSPEDQRIPLWGAKNFGQVSLREVLQWASRHGYAVHPALIAALD